MSDSEEGWKRHGLVRGDGLPAPTGKYAVGCVDLMHELEGDSDGPLLMRLFYPTALAGSPEQAATASRYQYAKWLPHKMYSWGTFSYRRSRFPGVMSAISGLLFGPCVPAFEGAPLIASDAPAREAGEGEDSPPNLESFPVIVFSHGLSGMRTVHSGVCCDLASHGYVVAAVEHRDRSAAITLKRVPRPGGTKDQLVDEWIEYERPESEREDDFVPENLQDAPFRHEQVKKRSNDCKQTLNILQLLNDGDTVQNMMEGGDRFDFGQFKSRLDIDKAAILGHSFGGGTTVLAMAEEPRFKCGIALDAWMVPFHGNMDEFFTSSPLLFINSYYWQWEWNIQGMNQFIKSSKERGNDRCSIITIRESDHLNQTDVKLVMPQWTLKTLPAHAIHFGPGGIDSTVAHQVNLDICHSFLKRHLLKEAAAMTNIPNLDGGDGCSEHIIHGSNAVGERSSQLPTDSGALPSADSVDNETT